MPVKLTDHGEPLAQTLKQATPAQAAAQIATIAEAVTAVDALLENADQIPAVAHVATAEVGTMGKDGAMTVETTEHVAFPWLTAPAGYQGPFGKLTYGLGATVNTGNFENTRPFVQIEIPFIPGQQEQAYAYSESWVDARLTNIVKAIKASISGA